LAARRLDLPQVVAALVLHLLFLGLQLHTLAAAAEELKLQAERLEAVVLAAAAMGLITQMAHLAPQIQAAAGAAQVGVRGQ